MRPRRAAIVACTALLLGNAPAGKLLVSIDLQNPFATKSAWRFTARQLPEVVGETDGGDNQAAGKIILCISADRARNCRPPLATLLRRGGEPDPLFDEARELRMARVVRPPSGEALLVLSVASTFYGDGDQLVGTRLLAYDRSTDDFFPIFSKVIAKNNNQEVRYIDHGTLEGAIITAEPTSDAPFGFWIIVSRRQGLAYRRVLRYRSATHYNDGNPLAVIDSEMPTIQRRLGLWKPGQPLPLPAGRCPRPHLIKAELWCT